MKPWAAFLKQWAILPLHARQGCRFALADPALIPPALARVLGSCQPRLLVITADAHEAERIATGLRAYCGMLEDERSIVLVPEVVSHRRDQWIPENEAARCAALSRAVSDSPAIFVLSAQSLLSPSVSPARFTRYTFTLRPGETHMGPDALAERLIALDYDNEYDVHTPGEFARRGGILDVYSPLYDAPVRVEFFGDEIESLRFFMPDTQRSFGRCPELTIVPRGAVVADDSDEGGFVRDYFPEDTPVAVCSPEAVRDHLSRFGDDDMLAQWRVFETAQDLRFWLDTDVDEPADRPWAGCLNVTADCLSLTDAFGPLLPELGEGAGLWHWQQLRDHLRRWDRQGTRIVACFSAEGEQKRFAEMLAEDPLTAQIPVAMEHLPIEDGVLFPEPGLVLLSERELFGRRPEVRRKRDSFYRLDLGRDDSMELEEGGYAVHAAHGICRYLGVRNLEVNGDVQEVMELEFDEEARLYVPLDQAYLVSRYVGGTKKIPSLSRLGGNSWKNTRLSAEKAAWDLASELLRLEALREKSTGTRFSPSPDWEKAFANAFPFEETPDQRQAIAAVLEDMDNPKPMDRLLCGDVGYGKTEVAMRAAFRAVLNNRQVAVLVPTTVLAQQHFVTFRERMAEYPVEIEMLSRFRSRAEQRHILDGLVEGRIDVIIGTHRLLQSDVSFADLGLVIVDEEQRFGVHHKQKLKRLRASVDILTMTATPIPRTLYFSLSGIRSLSTIMTAPAERLPVTTTVAHYDKVLLRHAILRELERQGQVYFLHNRVQTIERTAYAISQLVPEARIGIGHGQMTPGALERVMQRFVNGEIDVLVCTTIIESGIDIPNANTIIIDRADRFGLAELYQLRGRVGRYHHQAYAYLLLPPMGALPENVRQRLAAIRRYTHLGAGFKLAMKDLEIRGAGNILGTEQSGHIAAVGFELYCELLNEAVARLDRIPSPTRQRIPVDMDQIVYAATDSVGRAPASIPAGYIDYEGTRIECYRRITDAGSLADVDALSAEFADRFGPLPSAVNNLLQIARVRVLAAEAGIFRIGVRERRVMLETERGLLKGSRGQLPCLQAADGTGQLAELVSLLKGHALLH